MQTNEINLENRVESSALGKLGTGLKHAMYAARQYIAIGAAAISISIGAAGCTDDEVEECELEYPTPDNDLCNSYTEYSNPKDGEKFTRGGDKCEAGSYCNCTKPKGAPDYECFCECYIRSGSCCGDCGFGESCSSGCQCVENAHPL